MIKLYFLENKAAVIKSKFGVFIRTPCMPNIQRLFFLLLDSPGEGEERTRTT